MVRQEKICTSPKFLFVVLVSVSLHLRKENFFVEGVHRDDVDFVFSLPIPPGTDFTEITGFPQLLFEIALEDVPSHEVGECCINVLQESANVPLFDKRIVRIDVSKPEEKEGVRQHKAVTAVVDGSSDGFFTTDDSPVVFKFVELALDILTAEG